MTRACPRSARRPASARPSVPPVPARRKAVQAVRSACRRGTAGFGAKTEGGRVSIVRPAPDGSRERRTVRPAKPLRPRQAVIKSQRLVTKRRRHCRILKLCGPACTRARGLPGRTEGGAPGRAENRKRGTTGMKSAINTINTEDRKGIETGFRAKGLT